MLERAKKACLYCLNIHTFEQHGAKKGFLGEEKGFFFPLWEKKKNPVILKLRIKRDIQALQRA